MYASTLLSTRCVPSLQPVLRIQADPDPQHCLQLNLSSFDDTRSLHKILTGEE